MLFVDCRSLKIGSSWTNTLLEHQATDSKTEKLFAHLRKGDDWIVRDDVFVKYLGRHGGPTVGYGSPGKTGVELEFGTVMGDHFDEPVLLIKAAWGGHSLYQKFRSPSAGLPSDEILKAELESAQERVKKANEKNKRNDALPTMDDIKEPYGISYRNMMKEVEEFKGNVKTIRTDVFADKAVEALIDGWQNHVEEWKKVGSDRPYHYLGSAIWFTRIGHAFGETMIELMGK